MKRSIEISAKRLLLLMLLNIGVLIRYQPLLAQEEVISVVDSNALTCYQGPYGNSINGQSFQQDALVSYKGWQYIAYYDAERQVCLSRRQLPEGNWSTMRFTDYRFSYDKKQDNDTHNVISIGLCTKDGTIHLSFDQHTGPLHYRISEKGILDHPERVKWTSSLFKPVVNYLEEGKPINNITYPAFVTTPKGNLLFFYRNGFSSNGDYLMGTYNGVSGRWTDPHIFISRAGLYSDRFKGDSKSRNAYPNYISYDRKGVLHVSWTWRENVAHLGNRDICYAYSKDDGQSWYNAFHEQIGRNEGGQSTAISFTSKGVLVKELDRGWGIMNTQSQVIDGNLVPHIVMYHKKVHGEPSWAVMNDGAYFHYYRKNGIWQQNQLPFMGNRPQLIRDRQNNLFLVFMRKDHFDVKNQGAPLVVIRASANAEWKDWKEVYVSKVNYFNEPQLDLRRWEKEGVLSVLAQLPPSTEGYPSALQVVSLNSRVLNSK